jgi:hypothetical protein
MRKRVTMKRRDERRAWYWLVELLRGPTEKDRDYRNMLGTAVALAQSDLSDEEARERLHRIAVASDFGARGVVQHLKQRRDSYLGDRAYRLAEAVMDGRAVKPQDIALRVQFRGEEELGRLPLELAFDRLANAAPDLDAWRTAVLCEGLPIHVPEMKRVQKVVGPKASQGDALARSDVASAIAIMYLSMLAEGKQAETQDASYFSSRLKPGVVEVERRKPGSK